jgi:hypothetical protein
VLLLVNVREDRRARLQNVREPKALTLGGRVHILVRDATHVNRTEVVSDVAQGPVLRFVESFADALCPQDSIDVIRPRVVDKSIPLWVKSVNVVTL